MSLLMVCLADIGHGNDHGKTRKKVSVKTTISLNRQEENIFQQTAAGQQFKS